MVILKENEFVKLEETDHEYILIDKTLEGRDIVHTGETKEMIRIVIEFCEVNNKLHAVRTSYPKHDVEKQVVLNVFNSLTVKREKEKKRLEALQKKK